MRSSKKRTLGILKSKKKNIRHEKNRFRPDNFCPTPSHPKKFYTPLCMGELQLQKNFRWWGVRGGSAMAILSLFLKNTHPRKIVCWKCILTWCVKYSLANKINRCSRGVYMYFSHFEKKIMVWGPPIAAKSGILYFPGTLILVNICSKPPCFEAYFERLFADNFVSRPCIMLKFFSRVKNS